MRQGYVDSLQLMDIMGSDYINENLVYIRFKCKEEPQKNLDLKPGTAL